MLQASAEPRAQPVLIVEDDPIIATHLAVLISASGYEVVGTADEFEAALLIAERRRPKVAVVDVHLLGTIDGVTVGRELQTRYDTAIVFVTANLDQAVKGMEGLKAEFVGKPFSDDEVLTGLERAFDKIA
jgi:DNA-binding response OmpR family regulator